MQKKIYIPMIGSLMLSILVTGMSICFKNERVSRNKQVYYSKVIDNESKNEENVIKSKTDEEEMVMCKNAVINLTPEEYDATLDQMYEETDGQFIDELEDMEPQEINEKINSFDDKYELGEPLSEEDAATLLYVYEMTHPEGNEEKNKSEVKIETLAQVTRIHNIGWSKEKNGVKVSYKGNLKTWTGTLHGKYVTDVDVKIEKGKNKLKSMKWTTYHNAYGILGSSGKSVSLGKVYTGHVSSDSYKKNFSYEKSKTYSAILTCFVSTYGTLDVKYKDGEYSINTKTYKTIE